MPPFSLSIDPDIRRAELPPARLYTDPVLHALLLERVFARAWHFAGPTEDLPDPGCVKPFRLLPGCLDEPLVWTREPVGPLRCLSNVCTHRANLVVRAACRESSLRCSYHGRRFELDGRMRAAPGFEGALDFPVPEDDLPAAAHAQLGPIVFAGLEPPCDFDAWLGSLKQRLAWLPVARARLAAEHSRDYEVHANWMLYLDNYLEGFHIPYVHGGLNALLDFEGYRTELEAWSSVQIGLAKNGADCLELPRESPEHAVPVAGWYAWLFPATMLNVYPWGISLNAVVPLSVERTRVSFRSFVWDESKLGRGAGADLERVEHEDEAVVEAVQQGVRARLYRRGRYSPSREQGTHHFHRMLARALGPT